MDTRLGGGATPESNPIDTTVIFGGFTPEGNAEIVITSTFDAKALESELEQWLIGTTKGKLPGYQYDIRAICASVTAATINAPWHGDELVNNLQKDLKSLLCNQLKIHLAEFNKFISNVNQRKEFQMSEEAYVQHFKNRECLDYMLFLTNLAKNGFPVAEILAHLASEERLQFVDECRESITQFDDMYAACGMLEDEDKLAFVETYIGLIEKNEQADQVLTLFKTDAIKEKLKKIFAFSKLSKNEKEPESQSAYYTTPSSSTSFQRGPFFDNNYRADATKSNQNKSSATTTGLGLIFK